jgi:hypothetical protein
MFFNDCLDNGLLDCWLIFSGVVCCVWLKIINMKTQDIIIFFACVFSPPAQGNKDIVQLQEDLINEKADYQQDPELKKQALIEIIAGGEKTQAIFKTW